MSIPISFEDELMDEIEAGELPCSTISLKDENSIFEANIPLSPYEEDLPALLAKKARFGGLEEEKVAGRRANGERIWFEKKKKGARLLESNNSSMQRASYASPIFQMIREIESEAVCGKKALVYGAKSAEEALSRAAEKLWVDKYAPKKFTDLVSQDKCNIEVLKWVGQWSKGMRPEKSILLISGPPGLGKTTLVQVIASVSNYNLIEINASDDRGGEAVIQRIKSAITCNAISGTQSKPNLVLIDEIDGAANTSSETGLIKFLVGLDAAKKGPASAVSKKTSSEDDDDDEDNVNGEAEETSKSSKKTSKRGTINLCRPIICICNDLYVPALKPLRLAAQVITLRQPSPLHLSQRLRQVCELEGFKVDGKNLVDLCEVMEGDLRACLHALQFISTSKRQIIGNGELLKCIQSSGLKDIKRSSFSLLQTIFHHHKQSSNSSEQLLKEISAEEDRFLEGCHEIFLQTKFFDDPAMTKVNSALEWLSTADLWRASSHQPQLQRYGHFVPLKFRQLFASPSPPTNMAFPREDFEMHQRLRASQQILKTFLAGLPPAVLASWGSVSCLIDRAPLLLSLIKPKIRVPNPQLLKPGEKILLDRIVQIMANEGLTYRETKGNPEDNTYLFVLDPPIDILVKLANPLAPPANQSTLHPSHLHHESAIRKLVAHLVQQENIRRSQAHRPVASPSPKKTVVETPKIIPVKAEPAVKRDFFGRPIVPKQTSVSPETTQSLLPETTTDQRPRIFYKYNEGFSNAVRRTIRIRDLFGSKSGKENQ